MSRPFKFKKFTITQGRAAMKVGTDGVLLGAWCNCENASSVLDVGTGTGLIALMVAQRNPTARIDAVEINKEAFLDAVDNIANAPWRDRIDLILAPVQKIEGHSYDLIVTNPPFFHNSLPSELIGKNQARHTSSLSTNDLVDLSSMLEPEGILSGILPTERFEEISEKLLMRGLKPLRRTNVHPVPGKTHHRVLFEFKKTRVAYLKPQLSEIVIENGERHDYSDEYKQLTKDFYLKF
jgi:tRNA1Val (adenine37-N6)-methyltransferase